MRNRVHEDNQVIFKTEINLGKAMAGGKPLSKMSHVTRAVFLLALHDVMSTKNAE